MHLLHKQPTSSYSIQAGGVGLLEARINLKFDSRQTNINVEPLAKKQCKNYDATQKWQDNWASQFDCAESKMVDGMLVYVKCIVCDTITSQVKHIAPKHNNLEKHMGKQQVNHDIPSKGLKKNEIYYENNMFKILPFLALYNVCLFCNKLAMLLLGRINTRLSSLPLFFMFWKMVNPWLSVNI